LAGCAAASLVASVLLTHAKPVWAFYCLPTRAFELLAGCMLAISPKCSRIPNHSILAQAPAGLGLLLVVASFFFVKEGNDFPGYKALLPVIGAFCILRPAGAACNLSEKILSLVPLVFIGRMSYSLYLWHWPIFSFIDYKMVLASEYTRLVWKIGMSLSIAIASFLLIENPSRVFLNLPRNRGIAFAFLGCALILCVPGGVIVRRANYINADLRGVLQGGRAFNESGRKGALILMGDSNGSMYGKVTKEIARELDYKLNVITVNGEDPLPRTGGRKQDLWLYSLTLVKRERPDIVLLACNWTDWLGKDKSSLPRAINELKQYTRSIILFTQPPVLPEQASRKHLREGLRPPYSENPKKHLIRLQENAFVRSLQSSRVKVLDIESHFLTKNGYVIYLDSEGRQLYHDATHLSGYGAQLIKHDLKNVIASRSILSSMDSGYRSSQQ
jgi:hypothetical protein